MHCIKKQLRITLLTVPWNVSRCTKCTLEMPVSEICHLFWQLPGILVKINSSAASISLEITLLHCQATKLGRKLREGVIWGC